MTGSSEFTTDKGIGFAVLLTLLAIGAASSMFLSPGTPLAGWGFAVAMLVGSLVVVAIHVYWN